VLEADEELQRLVTANPGREELARYVSEHDLKTMFDDGLGHVREGETTVEEISRVINT
jgi:type II secretory ATPase GspE/PulE/Tfp pilus assembly ATPase PilB-like protein